MAKIVSSADRDVPLQKPSSSASSFPTGGAVATKLVPGPRGPTGPQGDPGQTTVQVDGNLFQFGAISNPVKGTAAASGGVLQKVVPLEEGYGYDFTVAVHGKQKTTNYYFNYLGRASAFRDVSGSAKLEEDPDLSTGQIKKTLTDPADGSAQDGSNIAVALEVSGDNFRVTVTNNDGSNDLAMTSAGIVVGQRRYALEPDPA